METAKPGFVALEQSSQRDEITESALGLISTQSFPVIVQIADKLLKSAGVILIGFEKIGNGHCTAIVRGRFADIRMAVEVGRQTAEEFDQIVSTVVIPRPLPNLEAVLPIGSRVYELARANHDNDKRTSNQAIGLIETRGFPAMVGAADAMLKAAEVQLASYEKTGAGLCTAIIRGAVADVLVALEVGVQEAERIGELNAVTVIPRPLEDLEQSLPVASCLLEEQPQPLLLPLTIKEPEAELVELPNLATLPAQIKNES